MYKLKWILKQLIRLVLGRVLSLFIKRDKNYWLFCAKKSGNKDYFGHNTKYFFLYMQQLNDKNIKTIWLCDNKNMLEEFEKRNFNNVYPIRSLKGIYYALKSKYWFYDWKIEDLPFEYAFNAIMINFWHGIPLKKIEYDMEHYIYNRLNTCFKFFYDLLDLKHNYVIANGLYDKECFKTAFKVKDEQLIITGSPRLDVLKNDIKYSNLFIEKDYEYIKLLHKEGKKIFIYMPTFRDTGKDISAWLRSEVLHNFLSNTNIVMLCKLHPADKNTLNSELPNCLYKLNSEFDVYSILKYTDLLITDYSSIYFDYMLLNKPIIHYVPDIEEYCKNCRGFYKPFKDFSAGTIAKNEQELINAMTNVLDNVVYSVPICNFVFKFNDFQNCTRVREFVGALNESSK